MKTNDIDVHDLLSRPIWQLTGEEFCSLAKYVFAATDVVTTSDDRPTLITGVQALAEFLSCSQSTIFKLRREGVLDGALYSHLGRKTVWDAAKARALADEYQRVHNQ